MTLTCGAPEHFFAFLVQGIETCGTIASRTRSNLVESMPPESDQHPVRRPEMLKCSLNNPANAWPTDRRSQSYPLLSSGWVRRGGPVWRQPALPRGGGSEAFRGAAFAFSLLTLCCAISLRSQESQISVTARSSSAKPRPNFRQNWTVSAQIWLVDFSPSKVEIGPN